MAVEIGGFEMVQPPVGYKTEVNGLYENGVENKGSVVNQPIKFGSHGDEPVKPEDKNIVSNVPTNVLDEWPTEKQQIYSFYFIRYRPFEDPKLKAKLELAEKEVEKKQKVRGEIFEGLKAKRSVRGEIISQLKELSSDSKDYWDRIGETRKKMAPLQEALGQLRSSNGGRGEKGPIIFSSEEDLNDYIFSLHYRMQHESIPLSEEKKILKEIKQLEQTRPQVIANEAKRAVIQESMGKKDDIQGQVKLIGGDLDGVRKEHQVLKDKIKVLEKELKVVDEDIKILQEQLDASGEQRNKAYENLQNLRKQRDEGNAHFYGNKTLLNNARMLASKRDISALEELSCVEVQNFMSQWSKDKAFRADYERRILPSLDSRLLSRDGRMRNPDEKPLVAVTVPEAVSAAKPIVKQPKEYVKSPVLQDTDLTKKSKEEPKKKQLEDVTKVERDTTDEKESILPKQELPVKSEVDEEKMKELKRQEEIAKAKMALDRKKKLAEKAAAKAALRAQKEAEKKLKEREKKAKKKAAALAPSEEQIDEVPEVAQSEDDKSSEFPSAPIKNIEEKKNTVRSRNRPRGLETVPKPILKRKKSTNYWLWAAPAALLVLVLLVVGYYYQM